MTKLAFEPHRVKELKAIGDTVIVADMTFESRTLSSGIILPNDDGKSSGIRPRWGRVYAVGPDQHEVKVGQWILVAHGRWTRGIRIEDDEGPKTIRKVDTKDIMLVSDERVLDGTMSDKILA